MSTSRCPTAIPMERRAAAKECNKCMGDSWARVSRPAVLACMCRWNFILGEWMATLCFGFTLGHCGVGGLEEWALGSLSIKDMTLKFCVWRGLLSGVLVGQTIGKGEGGWMC